MEGRKGGFPHETSLVTEMETHALDVIRMAGNHDESVTLNNLGAWWRWRARGRHYPASVSSRKRPDAMTRSVKPPAAMPRPRTIKINRMSERTRTYQGVRASRPTIAR